MVAGLGALSAGARAAVGGSPLPAASGSGLSSRGSQSCLRRCGLGNKKFRPPKSRFTKVADRRNNFKIPNRPFRAL